MRKFLISMVAIVIAVTVIASVKAMLLPPTGFFNDGAVYMKEGGDIDWFSDLHLPPDINNPVTWPSIPASEFVNKNVVVMVGYGPPAQQANPSRVWAGYARLSKQVGSDWVQIQEESLTYNAAGVAYAELVHQQGGNSVGLYRVLTWSTSFLEDGESQQIAQGPYTFLYFRVTNN